MTRAPVIADVCLLLEGTYPYVQGGVSSWVNDLIHSHSDLKFHVVALLADRNIPPRRYEPSENLLGVSHVFLQDLRDGASRLAGLDDLLARLEPPLSRLQKGSGMADVAAIIRELAPYRGRLGRRLLMDSPAAWQMIIRMYRAAVPGSSFLDFFWTWRAQIGGLFAALLAELPPARVYHTVCTGYAGLLAVRARIETGRPAVITEHGIYTNERRIEIAMADWLGREERFGFGIENERRTLKNLWVDTFLSYSQACYQACDPIVTLYQGNQVLQQRDGADPAKMRVIPNGIDYDRYSAIRRDPAPRPPTIAFMGRVVPIKDVKTFIHAVAKSRSMVPDVQALIMGPTEEDPHYAAECRKLVTQMNLDDTVTFTGQVRLEDYLGRIDVIVLTSISEAQPLVILEGGAAGVPAVATDVGACREVIMGSPGESSSLGAGGVITPLADPASTARGIAELLLRPQFREACSRVIRQRVELHYNKRTLTRIYRELYEELRKMPDNPRNEVALWRESALHCGE